MSPAWGNTVVPTRPLPAHREQALVTTPRPQRIVSLLPSLTETVCALGACARLVGVDRWSDWPAHVRTLPQVGGLDDVSLEQIVRLRPDLILAPRSGRVAERLEALGLPVLALEPQSWADTQDSIKHVARALGDPSAADALWQRMTEQIAAARKRLPATLHGQAVYLEVSQVPHAASAGSFVGALLHELGLRNSVPATLGPFPQLNPEWVVRRDPPILIMTAHAARHVAQRPGWGAMTAVRRGQVCGLRPTEWNTVVRPGPRLGEAAHLLVTCLRQEHHP
jgi:iron complex transport system substrate-binding protein